MSSLCIVCCYCGGAVVAAGILMLAWDAVTFIRRNNKRIKLDRWNDII